MPLGKRAVLLIHRHGVVVRELLLITPLIGVDIVPAWRVLLARCPVPVLGKGNRPPRLPGCELFLSDVVRQSTAVHADASAEHEGVDAGPIHQVRVIPVVDSCADDDCALPVCMFGCASPFTRELNQIRSTDAGVLLRPRGGIRLRFIVIILRIVALKSTRNAILGHQQVIDRCDCHLAAVGRRNELDRNVACQSVCIGKIVERDRDGLCRIVEERDLRIDVAAVDAVFEEEVPLPLFFSPSMTNASHGHLRLLLLFIPHQELPFAVLDLTVLLDSIGPQELTGLEESGLLFQLDKKWGVGVLLCIVDEIGSLFLVVEFFEQDVVDSHPPCAILPRVDRHPVVGILCHLVEVRSEDVHFRSVVARLCGEVDVGRASHVEVRSHHRKKFCVEPICGLLHIRLLPPCFRRRRRQVAIPIIERERDTAEELHQTRTGRIADHRHCRNRREACDAIRAVRLDRVHVRRCHDLEHLIPRGPAEPSLAARPLPACPGNGIRHKRFPGFDRIFMLHARLSPEIEQGTPDVRILHPQRTVKVPREGDAALASAGLIRRQAVFQRGVVESLHFPSDDSVFHMDHPGAASGAVDSVRASNNLVMLPAIAIKLFPSSKLRVFFVFDPTDLVILAHGTFSNFLS